MKHCKSDAQSPPSGLTLKLSFYTDWMAACEQTEILQKTGDMIKQDLVSPPGMGATVILTTARLLEKHTDD